MSKGTNARVAVQKATAPEAFIAGYAFEDEDDCHVQSSAATLTDSRGKEVLGPRPAASSIPVVATSLPSTLQLGKEFPVSAAPVRVLAANIHRVVAIVQNTGGANVRVGPAGVTTTTGYRLLPNQTIIYAEPNVNKGEIWAVGEDGNSVVFTEEETVVLGESPSTVKPPDRSKDAS